MSKADQLAAVLDEFLSVSFDVEAAAVVSSDGLPMASALPPDIEEDRLAAMSAALLSLGERAALGLDKGELAQVYVEGSDGNVVLMAAGRHAVLVAMTAKHAKAGLVLYEMRNSARRVERVFDEPANPERDFGRDAVSRHSVDSTPAPPPDPRPYTATESEPQRSSWEDQPIQPTPDWEAQPVPSTDWVDHAEENLEAEPPWGQEHVDQPQESGGQSIDESDRGHEVAEQSPEAEQQWSAQQPDDAQQADTPRQRDDEQKDENSSFTSW
jgi:predicted regulator of Ras-like GTPase activity (Roadblock/LC7/MglB family)